LVVGSVAAGEEAAAGALLSVEDSVVVVDFR
jgi:hypothetical protein